MAKWSLQDARDHFGDVVTAARHAPQTVTDNGKPTVVVVDAGEFDRLTGTAKKALIRDGKEMTFVDQLLAMPQKEGFEIERAPHQSRDIDL
ncbi:MAG: type II toxin-antitoxin system Phd/YefM family antitoxin [Rhizomicrobium sp.]